jgi:hypothetical protein
MHTTAMENIHWIEILLKIKKESEEQRNKSNEEQIENEN